MKTEYKTEAYNSGNTVLFILIFYVLFTLLLIALRSIISPIIGTITWVVIMMLPYIFEKKIKKRWFTKQYNLSFNDSYFSVAKHKYNSDEISKQLDIEWSEIKSYKFNFGGTKSTILTIYLRKGGNKVWSFKENKTFQEAVNAESIFSIFRAHVKHYNMNKTLEDQIILNKGILNSKTGTIIIYSELGLVVCAFIFHLLIHPQSSFLTLCIGVGVVASLFIRRSEDKEMFDKICKLV